VSAVAAFLLTAITMEIEVMVKSSLIAGALLTTMLAAGHTQAAASGDGNCAVDQIKAELLLAQGGGGGAGGGGAGGGGAGGGGAGAGGGGGGGDSAGRGADTSKGAVPT
jgi:hypothetical protein